MLERHYDSMPDFQLSVRADKTIDTNEGMVCLKDGFAYKIFKVPSNNEYYNNVSNIKNLGELDPNIFTVPISLIYFGEDFCGFKMINAGQSVWYKFLIEGLSLEEKKYIAYELKNIAKYLKRKRLVHGDIHLGNILCLDNVIKLTDINNISLYPNMFNRKNVNRNFNDYRIPQICFFG